MLFHQFYLENKNILWIIQHLMHENCPVSHRPPLWQKPQHWSWQWDLNINPCRMSLLSYLYVSVHSCVSWLASIDVIKTMTQFKLGRRIWGHTAYSTIIQSNRSRNLNWKPGCKNWNNGGTIYCHALYNFQFTFKYNPGLSAQMSAWHSHINH